MRRLMTDQELADVLGWTVNTIRHRRYLERGAPADRIPRWVDTPGGRPRALGTPQEELEAWLARNTTQAPRHERAA